MRVTATPRPHHQTQLRGRGRVEQLTMFPAVGRAWVVSARRLLSVIYLLGSFLPWDCLVCVFSTGLSFSFRSLGHSRMRMRTGMLIALFLSSSVI